MSILHRKRDVRDLSAIGRFETLPGHEHWPLRPLPSPRSGSLADAFPHGRALQRRVSGQTFWLSPATDLHGLCSTHMARRFARHRDVFECEARGALSPRVQRASGPFDLGRCQRCAGLEAVGGSGKGIDMQSQSPLRRRRLGNRSREHRLRAGLHDHRLVANAFPLGRFSCDQGGSEDCTRSSTCGGRFLRASMSPMPVSTMFSGSTSWCSRRALSMS